MAEELRQRLAEFKSQPQLNFAISLERIGEREQLVGDLASQV